MIFNLILPWKPVPQERPYVGHRGSFDRPKSRQAKQAVRLVALNEKQRAHWTASKADFGVKCLFCGPHWGADVDNLLKLILDALKGVFWEDDRQVVFISAHKLRAEKGQEHTEVIIEELSS